MPETTHFEESLNVSRFKVNQKSVSRPATKDVSQNWWHMEICDCLQRPSVEGNFDITSRSTRGTVAAGQIFGPNCRFLTALDTCGVNYDPLFHFNRFLHLPSETTVDQWILVAAGFQELFEHCLRDSLPRLQRHAAVVLFPKCLP
jgi:hypothetical protein